MIVIIILSYPFVNQHVDNDNILTDNKTQKRARHRV
jgi:hypothetical protein